MLYCCHGYHFTTDDGDPGIVIIYSSDDEVHNVLALSAVAGIPGLQQGEPLYYNIM